MFNVLLGLRFWGCLIKIRHYTLLPFRQTDEERADIEHKHQIFNNSTFSNREVKDVKEVREVKVASFPFKMCIPKRLWL